VKKHPYGKKSGAKHKKAKKKGKHKKR